MIRGRKVSGFRTVSPGLRAWRSFHADFFRAERDLLRPVRIRSSGTGRPDPVVRIRLSGSGSTTLKSSSGNKFLCAEQGNLFAMQNIAWLPDGVRDRTKRAAEPKSTPASQGEYRFRAIPVIGFPVGNGCVFFAVPAPLSFPAERAGIRPAPSSLLPGLVLFSRSILRSPRPCARGTRRRPRPSPSPEYDSSPWP